jgi:hypothetical protein
LRLRERLGRFLQVPRALRTRGRRRASTLRMAHRMQCKWSTRTRSTSSIGRRASSRLGSTISCGRWGQRSLPDLHCGSIREWDSCSLDEARMRAEAACEIRLAFSADGGGGRRGRPRAVNLSDQRRPRRRSPACNACWRLARSVLMPRVRTTDGACPHCSNLGAPPEIFGFYCGPCKTIEVCGHYIPPPRLQ